MNLETAKKELGEMIVLASMIVDSNHEKETYDYISKELSSKKDNPYSKSVKNILDANYGASEEIKKLEKQEKERLGKNLKDSDYMDIYKKSMNIVYTRLENSAKTDAGLKSMIEKDTTGMLNRKFVDNAFDSLLQISKRINELRVPGGEQKKQSTGSMSEKPKPKVSEVTVKQEKAKEKAMKEKTEKKEQRKEKERETKKEQVERVEEAGLTNKTKKLMNKVMKNNKKMIQMSNDNMNRYNDLDRAVISTESLDMEIHRQKMIRKKLNELRDKLMSLDKNLEKMLQ